MPNKVQSWSWLCRRAISSAGIAASVARERALLLVDVQAADGPAVKADLDDLQDLALQFHVLFGQFDPFLGLAHRDVVLCRVAQQGDQHGVVVFQRPFQLGIGAEHLTAVESPEVQFPGQVESQIPIVAELGGGSGLAAITAAGILSLRENFALGDSQLGPGLKDPRAVLFQVDVLVIGLIDQVVERRSR